MQIRSRAFSAILAAALVGLLVAPALPWADVARAADAARPKVVVVVGPTHGLTSSNLADGERIARIAEAHGADVRRVFHPNATWQAVVAEAQGANVLVYLGHGNGWPSPHVSTLMPDRHDGMGLNPVAGGSSSTVKYYGERFVAGEIRLAPNALVVLNHACYTAGSSEPGYPDPTPAVAVQRVDNFAAGFLAAGAAAVIAIGLYDADPVVEGLWGRPMTLDQLFMSSGAIGRYEIRADSVRTPGARLHLDPQKPTEFYRAITGALDLVTTAVLQPGAGGTPGDGVGPAPVDTRPPVAGIVDLPDVVSEEAFTVGWRAVDTSSGVAACDVQVSVDGGPWADWLTAVAATSAVYAGQSGHGYAFRVRCTDRAGNVGQWDVTSVWFASPSLATGGFARVTVGSLNVRAAPGTSAAKLGTLTRGTVVALTDGPRSASGYTWFQVSAPVLEWAPVSAVQSGGWVAVSGSDAEYLVPVQAPNATSVSSAIGNLTLTPVPSVGAAVAAEGTTVAPVTMTPNGDGVADALRIGYRLRWDLDALRLNVHRADDGVLIGGLDLPGLAAGDAVFDWDGRIDGGRVPDGRFVLQLVGRSGPATYKAPGQDVMSAAVRAATTIVVDSAARRALNLQLAAGYRTKLTTAYLSAVAVRNGTYVTLRATLGPARANAPVRFYQRVGKSGDWTYLSTGRTDASGTVVWSRAVRVPAAATGYGRYVYFKVHVPADATGASIWSSAVRARAR